MNYNAITEDIIRLSDERNTWSSTLCIPVNDSEEILDISSAAKGYNSSIPPGATNQPDTFPTGKGLISCYRFDPEIFKHESSWDDLRSILRDAASGCNLSIHKTYSQNIMRKKYYVLGCHHSRAYEDRSSAQYGDDTAVGPIDVVTEKSKRCKSHGTKRKGLNPFLVSSSFFIRDLIPISPHIGTLGMSAQRKRDIRQKSLEAGDTKPRKKNDVRRCITSRAITKDEMCTMKLHVYMLHNGEWYLHTNSCLEHCNHPPLPAKAKAKSSVDMSPKTQMLVSTF